MVRAGRAPRVAIAHSMSVGPDFHGPFSRNNKLSKRSSAHQVKCDEAGAKLGLTDAGTKTNRVDSMSYDATREILSSCCAINHHQFEGQILSKSKKDDTSGGLDETNKTFEMSINANLHHKRSHKAAYKARYHTIMLAFIVVLTERFRNAATSQLSFPRGVPLIDRNQSLINQARSSAAPIISSSPEEEARASHWSLPNRPSLFSIIRFPNEECFDSSNQSGTCYTAFECKLLGGQPSSPCAAGFGSCCIVSRSCHVSTREKVVYFKNPSYPSADTEERFCDLTVEVSDPNVCQLRLDFLDFQLDPPSQGACRDDYMEISASGIPPLAIPRLCGLNRNQHLYISVPQDYSQADRSASIVFYTDPVGDHRWQVKVTQIDCNLYKPVDWRRGYAKLISSPLWNAHPNAQANNKMAQLVGNTKYSTTFASGFQAMSQTASALAYELLRPQYTPRAPLGCLQYFTATSGLIESFNFGQYLNNLDYSICIQRQPETCRLVFSSSDYDWSINGVGVGAATSGVGDQDCARDYLMIPGGSRTGDGATYDRYCGGRLHFYRGQTLSAPVLMKTSGPIVLRFHSDAHFEGLNNGGFRLQYDQSAQDCVFHTQEEAGSLASQQLVAATLSDSRPLSSYSQRADSAVESVPAHYASQLSQNNNNNNIAQQVPQDNAQNGASRRQDDDDQSELIEEEKMTQHVNIKTSSEPEPPSSAWSLASEATRWLAANKTSAGPSRRATLQSLAQELTRAFQLESSEMPSRQARTSRWRRRNLLKSAPWLGRATLGAN